jgi:hypothetical protein
VLTHAAITKHPAVHRIVRKPKWGVFDAADTGAMHVRQPTLWIGEQGSCHSMLKRQTWGARCFRVDPLTEGPMHGV